jgi:neutral ceramidase
MKHNNNLFSGAAITDITPQNSQFLFGYPFVERMSEGTHDPLLSSALYLSNGDGQALLISNDVIFVSKASVSRIRREISKKTGIQEGNIMVSATHTHSGPVTVDYVSSSNDPVVPKTDKEYVRYMENKITEAGCAAFQNAVPAEAGFLVADGTGIGTNRHDPAGPADLNIPAVVIKNKNDEFIAAMLVCNMHPTILHEDSKLYSGDFPAFAREILQQQYLGSKCPVLYFTGAAGNQSPRHVTKENTFEEARRIGEIVATAVGTKINEGIHFISEVPVLSLQKLVDLPKRSFPDVARAEAYRQKSLERFEYLKTTSKNSQEIRTAEVDWFGAEELLHLAKLNEEGKLGNVYQSCLPAEIQVIKIGEWNFVAWPGEIFIEYALALKKELSNTFLITLANGELQGYIATEEAENKGFYEASNSIFHFSSGKIMVDETMRLVKKIQ